MNGRVFFGKQEHMMYCFPLKLVGIERDQFFPFNEMGMHVFMSSNTLYRTPAQGIWYSDMTKDIFS